MYHVCVCDVFCHGESFGVSRLCCQPEASLAEYDIAPITLYLLKKVRRDNSVYFPPLSATAMYDAGTNLILRETNSTGSDW